MKKRWSEEACDAGIPLHEYAIRGPAWVLRKDQVAGIDMPGMDKTAHLCFSLVDGRCPFLLLNGMNHHSLINDLSFPDGQAHRLVFQTAAIFQQEVLFIQGGGNKQLPLF